MPQQYDESVSEREEGIATHTSPDISVQSKSTAQNPNNLRLLLDKRAFEILGA